MTVISRADDVIRADGHKATQYNCLCDCGNYLVVRAVNLKNGNTKSCGCLNRDFVSSLNKKHGDANKTRLYRIWLRMKQRCSNSNVKEFHYYGGRGITVCEEWMNDFKTFREWAEKSGYNDELTLDRIDVNRGYEPSNCRWATKEQQANNMRTSRLITYDGKTDTISNWSKEVGISSSAIRRRLQLGWSIEEALTKPIKRKEQSNGFIFKSNEGRYPCQETS